MQHKETNAQKWQGGVGFGVRCRGQPSHKEAAFLTWPRATTGIQAQINQIFHFFKKNYKSKFLWDIYHLLSIGNRFQLILDSRSEHEIGLTIIGLYPIGSLPFLNYILSFKWEVVKNVRTEETIGVLVKQRLLTFWEM